MDPFKEFKDVIVAELEGLARDGVLPAGLELDRAVAEPPRDPAHGDIATNAALILAKPARMNPRALAEALAGRLRLFDLVAEAAVAGPGFINLRLIDAYWHACLGTILRAGRDYGSSDLGRGRKVNVEYVSANPTGPLHVGHGRGAVVGDALASLLAKTGHDVTREYYINDAGAQLEALARSVYYRYREALNAKPNAIPEGFYPGDYLVPVGQRLAREDGDKWLNAPEAPAEDPAAGWRERCATFGRDRMMELIRDDLAALGIDCAQMTFMSERNLHQKNEIDAALELLMSRDLIYTGVLEPPKGMTLEDWEPRPQTLFQATRFGDDVDRPLKKSDGSWTYFAADIAYHLDKFERGFATMIDVWGADHGGYVKRMQAAVEALTEGRGKLQVLICQMVKLSRGGVPVKMSKRAGTFVTLREVIDEVGRDVVRFIMLTRKNDAPLDFDLTRVLEQSRDNPVFYVQYAHARVCSVLRHAANEFPEIDQAPGALADCALDLLTDSDELGLIKRLAQWPRLVESAAEAYEPHRVAFYLYDLAAAFHGLWTKGKDETRLRFLVQGDPDLTGARLALIRAVALVIGSGLDIFGVRPVEEMR